MSVVSFQVPLSAPVSKPSDASPAPPQEETELVPDAAGDIDPPAPPDTRSFLARSPNYRPTQLPDERMVFTLRTFGTPAISVRVQIRQHELAGGLKDYLDIVAAIEGYERLVREEVEAGLWPLGKPEVASPRAKREQDDCFQAAYIRHQSPNIRALLELNTLADRISFLASWPDMVVDPPPGWEDLSAKEMPPSVVMWIQEAWQNALKEERRGNGRSSSR